MESLIVHPWYWLVLGLVLIGLESMGAGGFLLGGAVSAFLTAIISWLKADLYWTTQIIIFSCLTIVFTLVYYRLFRKFNQKSDSPNLNDRAAQLHGRTLQLTSDIPFGDGRVQIGDTLWKVHCSTSLKKGSVVTVYGNEGMTLLIKPVEP